MRHDPRAVNTAKLVVQISKGLIRHGRARRLMMFYGMLIALVMLFAGATALWNWLKDYPWLFLGYWAACAWVTFLVVLLAIYDLLKVRADGRKEQRDLERQIIRRRKDEDPH